MESVAMGQDRAAKGLRPMEESPRDELRKPLVIEHMFVYIPY